MAKLLEEGNIVADSYSLSFEAVCANRRHHPVFNSNKTLSELAVSYIKSILNFLGLSYGNGDGIPTYVCHGDTLLRSVITKSQLSEPLYKKISHTTELNKCLDVLNLLNTGQINIQAFFETMQFENANGRCDEDLIDPEGFVLLTSVEGYGVVYSKVKSKLYYLFHKIRISNTPKMMELISDHPKLLTIFPAAQDLKKLLGTDEQPGEILEQVIGVCLSSLRLFTKYLKEMEKEDCTNMFWMSLKPSGRKSFLTSCTKETPLAQKMKRFNDIETWCLFLAPILKENGFVLDQNDDWFLQEIQTKKKISDKEFRKTNLFQLVIDILKPIIMEIPSDICIRTYLTKKYTEEMSTDFIKGFSEKVNLERQWSKLKRGTKLDKANEVRLKDLRRKYNNAVFMKIFYYLTGKIH